MPDMDQSLCNPIAGEPIEGETRQGRFLGQISLPRVGSSCCARVSLWFGIGWLTLVGLAMVAQGQEAVRASMAGEAAAAAQSRAASTLGYYNLKVGPTAWNFGSGLGLQYNSNANLTENQPEGDFIFTPQINTRMVWPVSDMNSVNLVVGGGYSAYLKNQQNSGFFLTPGTGLSFDAFVGDFRINLHDRVSISQNSYQYATVTGTGNYAQGQNALGTTVLWDLNKIILNFAYDHMNYVSFPSNSGQPNGVFEVVSTSAGYMIKPQMLAGLELGGSLINYPGDNNNTINNATYGNARQWNLGGFYNTQVSDYVQFTGHAGYTVYTPQSGRGTADSGDFTGMYFSLALSHRLNRYVSYSLSLGRMVNAAYYGGPTEQYYANLGLGWQILEKISLSSNVGYIYGNQAGGSSSQGGSSLQPYSQLTFGVNAGRSITKHLTANLGCQFITRLGDSSGGNYNSYNSNYNLYTITLSLNYQF